MGIIYWETHAPVAKWISFLTLLEITKIHKLRSRSINFVLEFPQADLDVKLYIEFTIGIYEPNGGKSDYFLNLNKYIYDLKQASAKWFGTLKAGLNSRDFEQSQVDPCIYI